MMQINDYQADRQISGSMNFSVSAHPPISRPIFMSGKTWLVGCLPFRNWTMNVFFQGLFRDLYPPTGTYGHYWPWKSDNVERWHVTESWSEDNRDAHWPAPRYHRYEDGGRNFITQTRFLENGTYIRLKNLTINYNVPHSFVDMIGLTGFSVYLSGMNLWEYTGLPDAIDPEDIYSVNVNHYRSRTYTMGIRASF